MGCITIAAFRPNPGAEAELDRVLEERLRLLRSLGLTTNRAAIGARSRDGAVIQISEWSDDDAIRRAHETPDVLALWDRFAACCTFVRLDGLSEAHDDFATFEAHG